MIGLPPAHYGQLHARFEQYFLRKREVVDFEYNGRYYSIRIGKVVSYTQALAAAVTRFGELKNTLLLYHRYRRLYRRCPETEVWQAGPGCGRKF
ncbi:hypothetical protein [Intestinimonas butyriciproducens]|uniref:hypothetical protein n=1 Tax=Intestinimonas butyriciproducens TaxID=1297617 RepID=UPI0015BB8292